MIVTVKNPINNEDVEVDLEISTALLTQPSGDVSLQVSGYGIIEISTHTHEETI
jgi:hypothetical protein